MEELTITDEIKEAFLALEKKTDPAFTIDQVTSDLVIDRIRLVAIKFFSDLVVAENKAS